MELTEADRFRPEDLDSVEAVGPITDDERFATWHIKYDGHDAFLKYGRTEKSRGRLVNEAWGNQTMAHLAEQPQAPFRVPRLIKKDAKAGWLIAQFIDGQPLGPGDYPKEIILAAEPLMLQIYAFMDQAMVPPDSYGPVHFGSSHDAEAMDQKLRGKLDDIPKAAGQFEPKLIEDSLVFIKTNYGALKAAFAHGDLTPKHVMQTDEGKPYVIDFESCSLYWPRFYELINYTTKLNIVHGYTAEADDFIVKYFSAIKDSVDEHMLELKTIAAIRALLIVHELGAKPTNRRIYNTELQLEHKDRIKATLKAALA